MELWVLKHKDTGVLKAPTHFEDRIGSPALLFWGQEYAEEHRAALSDFADWRVVRIGAMDGPRLRLDSLRHLAGAG